MNWINATDKQSTAFDFTTKGVLQEAVASCQYWRLKDSNGKPPGLIGWMPKYAVTFIDNHDTGSTQRHWPFPDDKAPISRAAWAISSSPLLSLRGSLLPPLLPRFSSRFGILVLGNPIPRSRKTRRRWRGRSARVGPVPKRCPYRSPDAFIARRGALQRLCIAHPLIHSAVRVAC